MPRGDRSGVRKTEASEADVEEARSLLSFNDDDPLMHPIPSQSSPQSPLSSKPDASPISVPPSNGQTQIPRTPNRVRFVLDDDMEEEADRNGHIGHPSSVLEEEDYMNANASRSRSSTGQLTPLLTDFEAPTVTLAISDDFFPENHLENMHPKSGLRNAFMNMANSIIGAGIIGQPYAFRQAGLVIGLMLLFGLTIAVDWTIRLIVINSKLSGADSFQATVEFCFGRPGLIAISIAQWAFAFGGMVAFCIIIGDTIPHVFASTFPKLKDMPFLWLLTDRRAIIVLFVLGVSYPLSLYRDIAKLAKASTFALISMVVIVVTVIVEGIQVPDDLRGDPSHLIFMQGNGFFQAVGVISFDHNSLLIYGSLKKPTLDRFALVTHFSTGISMIMCLIMAFAGFLTFGDKTKGNILNNFLSDNVMVNAARLCFGLNMLATLPLEAFVCRSVMTTFFFPDKPYNPARHVIFTSSLVVTSVIISLLTCDLGAVFELIGATSACALAYILPPLCYIKLSHGHWKEKIPAYACILFGVVVLFTSLVQVIIKMKVKKKIVKPTFCAENDILVRIWDIFHTYDSTNSFRDATAQLIFLARRVTSKGVHPKISFARWVRRISRTRNVQKLLHATFSQSFCEYLLSLMAPITLHKVAISTITEQFCETVTLDSWHNLVFSHWGVRWTLRWPSLFLICKALFRHSQRDRE
ncbi:hypothetical protein GX48_06412 [Paracoccidioides brasiliensis]|nr:hypothetical protein GX48_06412 [Paracoccidioides brasiliensis]